MANQPIDKLRDVLTDEQIEFIALQDKYWGGFSNEKFKWLEFAKVISQAAYAQAISEFEQVMVTKQGTIFVPDKEGPSWLPDNTPLYTRKDK